MIGNQHYLASQISTPSSARAYAIALIAVCLAALARLFIDPWLGTNIPYATFFLAVVVAAWYGGLRPALLATVLGLLLAWWLIVLPRYSFDIERPADLIGIFVYLITALSIACFSGMMRDAQLRAKQAEVLISEQAERLRTTLVSIGDGVITTDSEGRITNLNAVAQSLTGWTNDEAAGMMLDAVFRIVNEETKELVENPVTRALREGTIVGLANHTLLIAKDGTERPIDDSAAPIRCKAGEIVGCVLVFRDISHRKIAEEEQRHVQKQIETTLESITDGFMRYDHDWRIVYVNNEAERINQLPRSAMLGKTPWELFPAVIGTKLEFEFRRAVAEKATVDFENYYEPWNRWYGIKCYPAPDGGLTTFIRDITERKNAEESVRLAEEQLRTITDNVPALISYVDTEGRYLLNNRAYERWFGHHRGEIAGRHMRDVLGDAAWSVIEPKVEAALAGQTVHYEAQVEYKDAGLKWVDATYIPSRGADGKIVGVVVLVNDITERKLAEERILYQNTLLEALTESVVDGILVISPDGRVVHQNQTFVDIWKFPPEVVEQKLDSAALEWAAGQTADPHAFLARVDAIYEHPDAQVREELTMKDGRVFERCGSPIRTEDARLGWVWTFRDITERKRIEEQLREAEQQFHTLADNICQLAWMARADGHIYWYNQRWYDYTGTTLETQEGWGWESVHDPAMLPAVIERWKRSLTSGEPLDMVFPLKAADGVFRPFLTRVMPVKDDEGRIVIWFGTNTDVTEQHEIQEKLRLSAAKLSDADRRKDEFLATLAHELRNPLAPIRNALEIFRMQESDSPKHSLGWDVIDRQISNLTRLVDDLLDISRITGNKLTLRKERVPIVDAIEGAIESSRPIIDEHGHRLTVTLPQKPIYLHADLVRLSQVFMNLLTNAAKYTEGQGHIWLTVQQEDSQVVVSVKDTGIGITPDKMPKVFDAFFQVDRSLERSQGGLGIGLSLVRRLVELHDGSVEAHSEGLMKGSEFIVRLPILGDPLQLNSESKSKVEEMKTVSLARRIVVVDDNQDSARTLAMLLKISGNEVHTANDGLAGVELVEKVRPDVVLLDLGMPKLNGFEACRHIREQIWGKDMMLIALTGWGQDEDRRQTEEVGFDVHMVKPVDHKALIQLLADLPSEIG